MAWFNIDASLNGTWHIVEQTKPFDWQSARVVLGLLVVVQGFETSRFLAGAYPPELRVRTMRYAQWLSGAIYMVFFLLAMAAVDDPKALNGNATGIIAVLEPAASSLVYLIVIGAVFAQLSAAVADSIGAGGLIEQVSGRRIDHRHAYPVIALIGIALTWSLDIFAVIALASRAFALFYLMPGRRGRGSPDPWLAPAPAPHRGILGAGRHGAGRRGIRHPHGRGLNGRGLKSLPVHGIRADSGGPFSCNEAAARASIRPARAT